MKRLTSGRRKVSGQCQASEKGAVALNAQLLKNPACGIWPAWLKYGHLAAKLEKTDKLGQAGNSGFAHRFIFDAHCIFRLSFGAPTSACRRRGSLACLC